MQIVGHIRKYLCKHYQKKCVAVWITVIRGLCI